MIRLSRSLVHGLAALVIALATMSFECGPPGRDIPCTDQVVEGDVLHVELVAPYSSADGGVWDGRHFHGYGAIPSCLGIDGLVLGASFDAKIEGGHESMLCTQFGFVPQWDAPRFGSAALPANLVPFLGAGSNEVALSRGGVLAPAGCVGLYGISLFAATNDVFAEPSFVNPYGTFVMRYFRTNEPDACGAGFVGDVDPTGATACGDMYLVRVTR